MKRIQKTAFYSYRIGSLPRGCSLCVRGQKLVLFVTGLCPRRCYYCPISDKKYNKDVVYADEWPTDNIKNIIKEAKLIDAKGAGFTGGDPLCRPDRTIFYLKTLKDKFGKSFHIHLYTSMDLINRSILERLYNAGLDEIRFHLDLDNKALWNKITFALSFPWDIGIEIPVIPKKEKAIKDIINFIFAINTDNSSKNKIKFLNLNELEIADNSINKLKKLGYKTKSELSYAVKGSEELAFKILNYIIFKEGKGRNKKGRLNVHYCTATLKDKIQLTNRIKRRARNTKKKYDVLTNEGTLIRGAIYLANLKPDFNYRRRLETILNNKKKKRIYLNKLRNIREELMRDFRINLIEIDKNKLRLLTSPEAVKRIKNILNSSTLGNPDLIHDKRFFRRREIFLAIVEEYPTYDQLEIDIQFL